MAVAVVSLLHSSQQAEHELSEFHRVFSQKLVPDELPELPIVSTPQRWDEFLVIHRVAPSKKEAVRLIQQGAVKVGEEKILDPFSTVDPQFSDQILKVGKLKFFRLIQIKE